MSFDHFEIEEFACPCCDENEIDLGFVVALDRARESATTPFYITSGYRCPDHNAEIGASETSSHVTGLACDIAAPDSHTRFLILRALFEHGFRRIGVNYEKGFIHVDIDDSKPAALFWGY